jgi:transcriptional regulator with XRE-family HTH domain
MAMLLTELREGRGWSKAQLARRARIDAAAGSRIESGRMRPYPGELRRLGRALGWPRGQDPALLQPARVEAIDTPAIVEVATRLLDLLGDEAFAHAAVDAAATRRDVEGA